MKYSVFSAVVFFLVVFAACESSTELNSAIATDVQFNGFSEAIILETTAGNIAILGVSPITSITTTPTVANRYPRTPTDRVAAYRQELMQSLGFPMGIQIGPDRGIGTIGLYSAACVYDENGRDLAEILVSRKLGNRWSSNSDC